MAPPAAGSTGVPLALTDDVPLPFAPPIAPMLATLARELPRGDFLYEPKWDGFRALIFRDGASVGIWSRHHRPFTRYFPELVDAVRALEATDFVLDGEIVVLDADAFDFAALMLRLHPSASRVERLSRETPASFIAFDLPAADGADLRATPFAERRQRLTDLLGGSPAPLHVTPATDDPGLAARWLNGVVGGGVDGVVAKERGLPYLPGKRAMVKVKREHTADCVVAGFRLLSDGASLGSLLLGLYGSDGELRHVGVAASFSRERRRELLDAIGPLAVPLAGHPWERGFGLGHSPTGRLAGSAGRWDPDEMPLEWIPVRPELVCEVAYDTLDGERFRHPASFRRWRPDRDPRSCTFEQFQAAPAAALGELIPGAIR